LQKVVPKTSSRGYITCIVPCSAYLPYVRPGSAASIPTIADLSSVFLASRSQVPFSSIAVSKVNAISHDLISVGTAFDLRFLILTDQSVIFRLAGHNPSKSVCRWSDRSEFLCSHELFSPYAQTTASDKIPDSPVDHGGVVANEKLKTVLVRGTDRITANLLPSRQPLSRCQVVPSSQIDRLTGYRL
jgi:hypothetical protein